MNTRRTTSLLLTTLLLSTGCLGGGHSGGSLTGTLAGQPLTGAVLDTNASRATAFTPDCRMAPGGSMALVFATPEGGAPVLTFALAYDRLPLHHDENRDRELIANPVLIEPGWLAGGDLRYRWRLSHPEGTPAFERGRLTFERALSSSLVGTLTLQYADGSALVADFDLDSDLVRVIDCDESFDPFSALPIPGPH